MIELSPILAISYRDLLKFLRDPPRLVVTFFFPFIFIGAFGGGLQASMGATTSFDFLTFIFTGVLAQTLFQSAAMGMVSLIEDRENDFSQELFVSPVSRYSIVFGKILGETLVALPQGIGILLFGLLLGIPISAGQLLALVPVALAVSLFGGAFGLVVLANLRSQRAANHVFPFIMLPQYFLGGVFYPVRDLPWYLDVLSRIAPMRYAIDLMRGLFYVGHPEYERAVLADPLSNMALTAVLFTAFLVVGTTLFVRSEQNR